jgi:hypothetical protein
MRLIALSGKPYSGKSRLARALAENYGYYLINYSLYLKKLAFTALLALGVDVPPHKLEEDKAKYREFLRGLGRAIGYDGPDYVHEVLADWIAEGKPPAVFDNVRTPEQFEALSKHGFHLVEVDTPYYIRSQRAEKHGVDNDSFEALIDNPIEQGMLSSGRVSLVVSGINPAEINASLLANRGELDHGV